MKINTYKDDLEELRKEFAKVDIKNIDSIQKWFAEHPYLTTNDHCIIADRSSKWVRDLKRKAYIKGNMPKTLPVPKPLYNTTVLIVPENWDTKEWLEEALKHHSVVTIAKAVGRDRKAIYNRYKRYGIKVKSSKEISKSKNACCTYDWCYEHYVTQQLTQVQCAKLAHICVQAFANWLNRFKIPIRKTEEAYFKHTNVRIWVRRLYHKLRSQEIVKRARMRRNHIYVNFRNFFWEAYYLEHKAWKKRRWKHSYLITKDQAKIERVPQVVLEFESRMDGSETYPAHIKIDRKTFYKSSFMEQRLAIHTFARVICRRGWIRPKYPKSILDKDWHKLQTVPRHKFIHNGVFYAHPRQGQNKCAGQRIIEHFFDMDEFGPIFRSPRRSILALNHIMQIKAPITLHSMIRFGSVMTSWGAIYKIFDPNVYTWLFRQLGVTGTVLDLHPGYGHKAIACALAGLTYTTIPTPLFQQAVDNGFTEYLGLKYEPYNGQDVNLLINDNDFRGTGFELALPYLAKAQRMLYLVHHEDRAAMAEILKPTGMINIKTAMRKPVPDHLFIL